MIARIVAAALLLACGTAAGAATGPAHAVGADLFGSTDADGTAVVRAGLNLDFAYEGPDEYLGVRIERAWFNPGGQGWQARERVYVRGADDLGQWTWTAQVGTDGDSLLGSASIHDDAAFRKEFFVEREILETPQGLARGLYYTFAGGAIDLPADDRNIVTLVGGLQAFTGDNVRTHLRANYVHVVKPDLGLSAQLRTRWFRDSVPHEYDYYSPRWYAQVLPVLQMRRTSASGWRYLVAGGLGLQRDSATGWRRSSYFNAQLTSPAGRPWTGHAAMLFSETPTTSGRSYSYLQFTAGMARAF